ncbi:MAG: hypothetical protein JWN79_203 [Gemmatimonadetes bacterium]|jgi:hypothetical protein|nr:hypothetical protein [Gemmatimonadota bacterium]
MSEAALFVLVFVGFFILRGVAATVFFFFLLPTGDRCPHCDAVTVRVQSRIWNRLLPGFRTSWCLSCNWHGLLREGPLTPTSPVPELTKKP